MRPPLLLEEGGGVELGVGVGVVGGAGEVQCGGEPGGE